MRQPDLPGLAQQDTPCFPRLAQRGLFGRIDMSILMVLCLAFIQNVSFTMVSRARNRDNMAYHAACSVASNGLWFAIMGILVVADFTWLFALPYIVGTVLGSLFGAKVSMHIEHWIGATT